ncbi:Ribonuclease J1 [Spiroplasma sp. JKS002671]|uniref:ribonuclease J n=1 Tax=Spiroplasma attinicola TaxID=2904537 RepID=UPI002022B0AE|nr:ribonuclease J [Spiroplasma sp. JKS002671]MCL8210276.1 Ribonuclease J1 [Spiroplasma sp. JKS002671]
MNQESKINNKVINQIKPNNSHPTATKIFALGGLEEVGKNTYVIEQNNEIILIDAGVKFPDATMPGIEAVIPDYSYLKENKTKIKAIFITHGHEDHIGGIPYLLKEVDTIPKIYAPKLASALIRYKLKDKSVKTKTKIEIIDNTSIIKTHNFTVNFFAVNHSIPDAFGVCVKTSNGTIVSTGDYKFDWTPLGHNADLEKMAQMGKDGTTLFLADSTNAEVSGYTMTETIVVKRISELFSKAKGRILISTFASNVHRIQQIIEVATKHQRKVIVQGRSLERIISVIRQMGHLKVRDDAFIKPDEAKRLPNNQVVILCTGSQGEPLAALSRIANREHRQIRIIPGDTVIFSSSAIPGNKLDVERVINKLTRLNAIVEENSPLNWLHTSGHASQEEQKLMLSLIKPKYFMPMHGDYRMLKTHKETAVSVGVKADNIFICANGDTIIMEKGQCHLSNKRINADPVYVDGGKDMSEITTTAIIRDRQILSKEGLIAIVVSIDSQNNKLLAPPTFISRGSFYVRDSAPLVAESIAIVTRAINDVLKSDKVTFAILKNTIKSNLAPFIFKKKRRNPLIIPVILNKK